MDRLNQYHKNVSVDKPQGGAAKIYIQYFYNTLLVSINATLVVSNVLQI